MVHIIWHLTSQWQMFLYFIFLSNVVGHCTLYMYHVPHQSCSLLWCPTDYANTNNYKPFTLTNHHSVWPVVHNLGCLNPPMDPIRKRKWIPLGNTPYEGPCNCSSHAWCRSWSMDASTSMGLKTQVWVSLLSCVGHWPWTPYHSKQEQHHWCHRSDMGWNQ